MEKHVVLGVIYQENPSAPGTFRIMTQTRRVQNKAYDPLYDMTQEVMGETPKKVGDVEEHTFHALRRGIEEECGVSAKTATIRGHALTRLNSPLFSFSEFDRRTSSSDWTTGRGDLIRQYYTFGGPLCVVESLGAPQTWFGPAYLVEVPADWQPDFSKADGEANDHRWWTPQELLEAIRKDPKQFMGLHMPALKEAAELLLPKSA